MSSNSTTPAENNPRKRRRLNTNLATSDRMQIMVGIEKRKVEKLKQELKEALKAKDNALKELGEIQSHTNKKIEDKNIEVSNLENKLEILFHETEELKQHNDKSTHQVEIIQSQLESLQKENFKLRSQIYNNKSENNTNNIIRNGGHINIETNKENNNNKKNNINYQLEFLKLKKEIEIKNVTVNAQNEEIIGFEQQIKEMNDNHKQTQQSLNKASKHIQRLQKQLNDKTENQSKLAESEMENIREGYERKIRLLKSSMNDYKKELMKLKIISEEYELNKNKYLELKKKCKQLIELNTKYEPVYNELNKWKNILREMCYNLFSDAGNDNISDKYLFENEYELKICLKQMNEKYILLIKERDEYKSNMLIKQNKLIEMNNELNELEIKYKKICKLKQDISKKMNGLNKQLNECKIECQSYKNILNTYNVMSPTKNNQQKQINTLYQQNNKLNAKIKELNKEIIELNKQLEDMEIENIKLEQRVSNGEFNTLNTKVLNMKNNPLKLAMDKQRNEQKNKLIMYEEKIKDLEYKLNILNKEKGNNNDNDFDLRVNEKYYELENKYNILIKKNKLYEEDIENIGKELASSKKINQRMKSLFGKKAGEYRERIYQMTGYNVCLLGDGKHYRLQHLWMNDENDEIILQIDKLGQLQLKDTDFMRNKMDKRLLNKLKQTRSLPIFLSELTLWLYKDE